MGGVSWRRCGNREERGDVAEGLTPEGVSYTDVDGIVKNGTPIIFHGY
jgi:hypothetical protein